MVQSMGSKIDEKIKAGEINESEILNEGLEMINKMKNMPGMGDITKMFGNMENMMPGKQQMAQAENKLKQNTKMSKMKERMNKKREANAKKREVDPQLQQISELQNLLNS
jgi:hypothetical protein